MPKTDSARKEYQFFGFKRYLYQDNERVAHIHVVMALTFTVISCQVGKV